MTQDYTPDHDWHESAFESATDAARYIGLDISDIYYSGFWSQGDGASFTGSYSYKPGAARAIRTDWPLATELHAIADTLQAVQRRNFYRLEASVTQSGRYSHEMTMRADVDRTDGVDVSDDDSDVVLEAMRDFARWIYRTLESEYEYQTAWNAASHWQDLATEAQEARDAARQTVKEMRVAPMTPAMWALARNAVRRLLNDWQEALQRRETIDSDFGYWQDGVRQSVAEFAAENL